jgi:hypothetical protein
MFADILPVLQYVLRAILAGGSGLLLVLSASSRLHRPALFASVSAAIISAFLIIAVRDQFPLHGDTILIFAGLVLLGFSLLAVANLFAGEQNSQRLAESIAFYFSAIMGIIIGLELVLLGFIAIIATIIILNIGKILIVKE